MQKVAIMTDTNSGIVKEEADSLGIALLPMPFIINGKNYLEGVNLTHNEFYALLDRDADVSTSQPAPGDLCDMWDKVLEKGYDEIVYIPMSSGLSKSCETAIGFANNYDGKVFVVDNQRISVTQRQSVLDALKLAEEGKSGKEIKEILERDKLESSIYITLDTLKYLKKGGRITAAAAAIGTVLNLKPVLQIQGEKLDAYSKVRGMKMARKTMIDAIKKDIENRFLDLAKKDRLTICIAYSFVDDETLQSWVDEVKEAFPTYDIYYAPLSLSVGCHIGPGALAITACIVE